MIKKKVNPEKMKKSVYTPFGYGFIEGDRVDSVFPEIKGHHEEPEMLSVKLKNGATVSLSSDQIQSSVTLRFKTFYGPRKVYEINAAITDTIEKLKTKLINLDESMELVHCKQIRIVYPVGKMTELTNSFTIESLELPDKASLVVIGLKNFAWDANSKGNDIELSNSNTTANKKQVQDYESVLGNVGFSGGRHYWEIKIEAIIDLTDIMLGIAPKDVTLYSKPGEGLAYWGYACCAGKIFSPKEGSLSDYGEMCVINDLVGVLLDFSSDSVKLTFYRNKKCLGVAFTDIPLGLYYPIVTMFYSGVRVTLITNLPVPVENPS